MRGRDVEMKRLFHVLRGRIEKRVGNGAAKIVDDDVEPTEGVARRVREPGDVGEVGQIGGDDQRPTADAPYAGRHVIELRGGTGRHDHVGPRLGERDRAGGPDPPAGAGHNCDVVGELESVEDHRFPSREARTPEHD